MAAFVTMQRCSHKEEEVKNCLCRGSGPDMSAAATAANSETKIAPANLLCRPSTTLSVKGRATSI